MEPKEPVPSAGALPESLQQAAHRMVRPVRDQAMFLLDREGRIASWNEGVGLILGWVEAEWIGQPVHVAFTAEDIAAGTPEHEMRVATASGRADDDRWMRRRNGERFYALGAMTRMLDDRGALVGYLKMLRDHTRQKWAEEEREALLRSERDTRAQAETQAAVLTAAIEAISDGVCIGDATGIRRCNRAALRLLGAGSVEEVADPATIVSRCALRRERHGPLLPLAELPFVRAVQGEHTVVELWATPPHGADVWLRWAAAPVVVDDRVVGAVVVLSDLAQRLELAQTGRDLSQVANVLHERDAELRALTDGVRDYAIFTIEPNGRISSWHQGAALMKGYSVDEAIGMEFTALFTPEQRAAGRPQQEMEVAARTGEYKGDGLRMRKDGTCFEAAVVLTALRDAQGQLRGFLKLTQDITQRKRHEREREEALQDAQSARAEAERASHSKGEFLATISHELRTPLSAILGWAHVLERGLSDTETVNHGLAAISRNARIQVQLIEDLLDMNRIESGQLRLDLQRVELSGVVAAAIDSALPSATAKGIGLRTVFGPAAGNVMGDSARLQQVVGNLLSNAIKFTPSGGQISVALTQYGDVARLSMADTGQGIEPEFLERMFDRFQQQDATTTRRHGGLGLGLAIVRHLVQLHGGAIHAHSAGPGRGATFTISLPALPETAPPSSAMRPASGLPLACTALPPRLNGLKVLVIDDEPDLRTVIGRVLTDAGALVVSASNAVQGLELLVQERPDVILSDIAMPGTDGYELLRQVRSLPAAQGGRTPAAALTAYTRPEDRQQAMEVGYQLYLPKPAQPDALVSAVADLAHGARPVP